MEQILFFKSRPIFEGLPLQEQQNRCPQKLPPFEALLENLKVVIVHLIKRLQILEAGLASTEITKYAM